MAGKQGQFGVSRTIKRLVLTLGAACIFLLGLNPLVDRSWDEPVGLFGFLDLAACAVLVVIAKDLRKALERLEARSGR